MRNHQTQRQEIALEAQTAAGLQRRLRVADPADAQVPSPATAIQQLLAQQLHARAEAGEPVRWCPRSTIAVSVSVSLALWAAIAAAAYAALR